MKTKGFLNFLIVATIIGTFYTSCKKSDSTTPDADDSQTQQQSASDQLQTENESNQSIDDVNTALNGTSTTRSSSLITNATIDSSMKAMGMLTITYSGISADGTKSRSGTISIQIDTTKKWHIAGATVTITFNNYKVTKLSNNKSITFNGTHTITNVNGGTLATITTNTPVIHKIRGNSTLTFDDGTQRTWNVARKRTFNYVGGIITVTLSGDTTVSGYTNVAMWGKNRADEDFYVSTTTPLTADVFNSTCMFKPVGVRVFYGALRTLTVTYGVDKKGEAVTSGCPYGYKLNWINAKGIAKEVILAY
jgi:hypothetical protein